MLNTGNCKIKGTCWNESMEKEALFRVDRKHRYKFKHPVLNRAYHREEPQVLQQFYDALPQDTMYIGEMNLKLLSQHIASLFTETLTYEQRKKLIDDFTEITYPTTINKFAEAHSLQKVDIKKRIMPIATLRLYIKNAIASQALEKTKIKDFPCTCRGENEISLMKILPTAANSKEVICYNSCLRTLFAAFKRATMQVYPPEERELEKFGKFAMDFIDKYLTPHLDQFDYSFSQWFNKMPLHKQKDIQTAQKQYHEREIPNMVTFGLFCKREKQEFGGKNRAIANIDPITKLLMGPVTWALEDVCDNYFPGYCGKKDWNALEEYYMSCEQDGFKHVLQGDGSAFDLSQHAEIKKYVDFYIYKKILDKIYHVDPVDFERAATQPLRKLKAVWQGNRRTEFLANAEIYGTVFSGASDTTLMNTIRMSLYNHYTLQRKGYQYNVDYRLLSKGDDFIVFTKQPTLNGISYEDIYYEIWSRKAKSPISTRYTPHGIGQILKFLIVGSITDIDFCSTCVLRAPDGSIKIVRRPERMVVLDSYSRSALKLTNGQRKQYLLDLALALDISHGNLPFYRDFRDAYRFWASRIKAEKQDGRDGPSKITIPDDGHKKILISLSERIFENYGHDFHRTFLARYSEHTVPENTVYDFLLEKYGISQTDIEYHRELLFGMADFNSVQQSIDQTQ